jgi:hypothetical protein
MPSFRHTAALTSATLLALALSLALAASVKAQCCPLGGGYRYTTAATDRFSGIKTIHSHFPPAYKMGARSPVTANLYAFISDNDVAFAVIFTTISEKSHCPTTFILADGKPVTARAIGFNPNNSPLEASGAAVQDKLLADAAEAAIHYNQDKVTMFGVFGISHLVQAESFTGQIDATGVAQLGVASKIEFKICNDEVKASPEFVQAAHEFACRVAQSGSGAVSSPAPPPSAPPSPI